MDANPLRFSSGIPGTITASVEVSERSLGHERHRAATPPECHSKAAGAVSDTLPLVGLSLRNALGIVPSSKVLAVLAGYDSSVDGIAEIDGVSIRLTGADADVLPFSDATFDAVLSPFGVMFAANHARAAHELMRICRPRGRVALANWTPGGFMGRLLAAVDAYAEPPPAAPPAVQWGDDGYLEYLFRGSALDLHTIYRNVIFRFDSAERFVDALRCQHEPVRTAFARLSTQAQRYLVSDLFRVIDEFDLSTTSTRVVLSEYVEVVMVKN
jgi:SAM-dependent methyltransferase